MNVPSSMSRSYAAGRSGVRGPGVVGWVLLALFVGFFFLPYLPGTRLRADVVAGYAFLLALPFVRAQTHFERQFLVLSGYAMLWSSLRIGISLISGESSEWADNYFFATQLLTALNFPLFSIGIFLALRKWLAANGQNVLLVVFLASVLINAIALFQWLDVNHPFNSFIFEHYGGALPTSNIETLEAIGATADITTNAEFLAKVAGRFSSIFGGMYVLAAFDVLIIALTLTQMHSQEATPTAKRVAAITLGLAFLGGVLSASKTFYFGTMIIISVLAVLKIIDLRRFIIMTIVLLPIYYFVLKGEMSDTTDESSVASVFEIVLVGDMQAVFGSRYSVDGLLGTIAAVFGNPAILLFGVGVDIGDLYLADNGYLMPIIIAGMPLALLTYGMVGLLVRENYRQFRRGNSLAAGFLGAHMAFLVAAVGIPTYQLPRVTLLFLVLNLVFLASRQPEVQFPSNGAIARRG